jgi:hypothetical protein
MYLFFLDTPPRISVLFGCQTRFTLSKDSPSRGYLFQGHAVAARVRPACRDLIMVQEAWPNKPKAMGEL